MLPPNGQPELAEGIATWLKKQSVKICQAITSNQATRSSN